MVRLVDLASDVWQVLVLYLKNRHYARLALAGDKHLQTRLRSIRARHFELAPGMRCADPLAVSMTILGARSLTCHVSQLDFVLLEPTALTTLTKLELTRLDMEPDVHLTYTDFRPLVALVSLNIHGYSIKSTLRLPRSICSVRASRFNVGTDSSSPLMVPIADLEQLESLSELLLDSHLGGLFMFPTSTVWPPSLTSLQIHLGHTGLSQLPRSLLALRVTNRTAPIDVYKLVEHHCPDIASLTVEGDASVTSRITQQTLYALHVSGQIVNSPEESFFQTASRLPQSLRVLHVEALQGTVGALAMRALLPRMQFESLDHLARTVIRCCPQDDAVEACLVDCLKPWLQGDEASALAYLGAIKSSMVSKYPQRYVINHQLMRVEDLDETLASIPSDVSRDLLRYLMAERRVYGRAASYNSGEYRSFSTTLRMLELGAIDWLSSPNAQPPSLNLSDVAIRNLVELRVYHFDADVLGKLLAENVLVALERVSISPNPTGLGKFVAVLWQHKSNLPRLEQLNYSCSHSFNHHSSNVDEDTLAKLADMKLYQKRLHGLSLSRISFVYRLTAPRENERQS